MLTAFDDYFIHQAIETIDHVASGDPRFQDRLYFNVHGQTDDFLLNLGIGAFPNQNMMDGYICAARGTKQYNVRVSRPLNHDRWKMFAGPLHLEILEPMKRWRIALDHNDYGVAFDLVYTARTLPLEHHPIFHREDGYVTWHQQHLQQSGTYEGWVEIGGERMPTEGLIGSRDRTWGVRGPLPGTVATAAMMGRRVAGLWLSAQLPSFAVHCWAGKNPEGQNIHIDGTKARVGDDSPLVHFTDWTYEVARKPDGLPDHARVTFTQEDGGTVSLVARPTIYINLLGTGFFKGFFGTKRTETYVEGDSWDHADPEVRARLGTHGGDVLSTFECDGESGWGVFESQLLAVPPA